MEKHLTMKKTVFPLSFIFDLFADHVAPAFKLVIFKLADVLISIPTEFDASRFTVHRVNSVVVATLSDEFVLSVLVRAANELAFLFFSFPIRKSKGTCDFSALLILGVDPVVEIIVLLKRERSDRLRNSLTYCALENYTSKAKKSQVNFPVKYLIILVFDFALSKGVRNLELTMFLAMLPVTIVILSVF